MNFDDIHLLLKEKRSLFCFYFKKERELNRIKCFHTLYYQYKFIENVPIGEDDEGNTIFKGVYRISDNYRRYKVYLRKKRIQSLPNWVAILISIISLMISALTLLWQLGYLQPQLTLPQ